MRARSIIVASLLLVAGCGGQPALPEEHKAPERVESDPPSPEENERHVFSAQIVTRNQQKLLLNDCTVFTPESTFLGGSADGKRERLFRKVTRPDGERIVGFLEIAVIQLDPVKDYQIPVRIRFRARERQGMFLEGTLRHTLRLEGRIAGFGAAASVALKDVAEVLITEDAK